MIHRQEEVNGAEIAHENAILAAAGYTLRQVDTVLPSLEEADAVDVPEDPRTVRGFSLTMSVEEELSVGSHIVDRLRQVDLAMWPEDDELLLH